MKSLFKSTIVMAAVFVTVSATAAPATQNELLTQCKNLVQAEFNDVKRIKMSNMKNRRGTFSAKFRVSADDQRAVYVCTVEKDSEPQIARTDKVVEQVAGGE